MPEPEYKNPQVDATIIAATGINRKQAVRRQQCPFCKKEAKVFRDERSRREQTISGLCQACQDEYL